jgi:hypothetical protein
MAPAWGPVLRVRFCGVAGGDGWLGGGENQSPSFPHLQVGLVPGGFEFLSNLCTLR